MLLTSDVPAAASTLALVSESRRFQPDSPPQAHLIAQRCLLIRQESSHWCVFVAPCLHLISFSSTATEANSDLPGNIPDGHRRHCFEEHDREEFNRKQDADNVEHHEALLRQESPSGTLAVTAKVTSLYLAQAHKPRKSDVACEFVVRDSGTFEDDMSEAMCCQQVVYNSCALQ